MTLKEANTKLQFTTVRIRRMEQVGEYRVNFTQGTESTAYYTPDLNDAYDTAVRMHNQLITTHLKENTNKP